MKITVTTPTGNVGSTVVNDLMEKDADIVLVARHREKLENEAAKGATIVEGSHADADLLISATKGSDALFLATPPNFNSNDIVAHYKTFGNAAAKAIEANKIPYVVHLSSVGAELESGTGPIVGAYENEKILNQTGANIAHLRPAYFMENTLSQIPSILSAGQMFTPLSGDKTFPMIATRDIGERAARLLLSRDWQGIKVVELMGAADMSYDKVATILSDILDRSIQHKTVPGEALIESLTSIGASEHVAKGLLDLTISLEKGRIHFSGERNDENRTPTTYKAFASSVYKAAFASAT